MKRRNQIYGREKRYGISADRGNGEENRREWRRLLQPDPVAADAGRAGRFCAFGRYDGDRLRSDPDRHADRSIF